MFKQGFMRTLLKAGFARRPRSGASCRRAGLEAETPQPPGRTSARPLRATAASPGCLRGEAQCAFPDAPRRARKRCADARACSGTRRNPPRPPVSAGDGDTRGGCPGRKDTGQAAETTEGARGRHLPTRLPPARVVGEPPALASVSPMLARARAGKTRARGKVKLGGAGACWAQLEPELGLWLLVIKPSSRRAGLRRSP